MRPVADTNSALQSPLNEILGYQGNIRVLRCLTLRKTSISYTALADQTGISLPGVHKVVTRLHENGIISYRGSGKRQLITLREDYPLYSAISTLFHSEKNRFDDLINTVQKEVSQLGMHVKSAWIYGSVANGSDVYGDPVQLALLGESGTIDRITDELQKTIREHKIESKYDVSLEITGLSEADLAASKKTLTPGYLVIHGMDPIFFAADPTAFSEERVLHRDLERQSLQASKALGQLLLENAELIPRTLTQLNKRIEESNSGTGRELKEWKHLLESMSLRRIVKFLESDSDRSARLRQSNPFWIALTRKERERLHQLISKQPSDES